MTNLQQNMSTIQFSLFVSSNVPSAVILPLLWVDLIVFSQKLFAYAPKTGAYTELFAGLHSSITAENNGGWGKAA
jgi:hypothetical protein